MKIGQKYRFVLLTAILGYVILLAVIVGRFHLPLEIFCLFLVAAYSLFWLIYGRRELLLPLELFTRFAERLTGREPIPPLRWRRARIEEIESLQKALNLLRDYQQDMENKLRQSYVREVELKRESERQGELKTQLMVYYLSDLIAPVSMLEGAADLLKQGGGGADAEMGELFCRNLARIRVMADRMREIGAIRKHDFSGEHNITEFAAGDFMQSVFDSNRFFLNERGVKLVNSISGRMPEKLRTDRAMLQQLLMITIRSAGRCAGVGEHITYQCEELDGRVVFTVSDARLGECLFPLAENFKNSERDNFSQLGLQLVGAQVQQLGGRIETESNEASYNILRLVFDRSVMLPPIGEKNDFIPEHHAGREVRSVLAKNAISDDDFLGSAEYGAQPIQGRSAVCLELPNADQKYVLEHLLQSAGIPIAAESDEADILLLGLPLSPRMRIGKSIVTILLLGENVREEQLGVLRQYDFHQIPPSMDYCRIVAMIKKCISR